MAKKLPEWFVKDYSEFSKNLWGAFRAFFSGFVGSLATCLITANTENILTYEFWIRVVLVSSITGGLVFLGKWLRDQFYTSVVAQRIPI